MIVLWEFLVTVADAKLNLKLMNIPIKLFGGATPAKDLRLNIND